MGPLEAALKYIKRGWSVIPVTVRGKSPLVKWEPYHERIATEDEVRRWWTRWPRANVGIVTGQVSNLVVLDIDTKKSTPQQEELRRYAREHAVMTARTGGGGLHLFFRHPGTPTGNRVDINKWGIDLRADGGLVVAAPSIHENGNQYTWIRQYRKLKPLPDKYAGSNVGVARESPNEANWLTEAWKGVGKGARNDVATRLAGYYFGKKMPADVVLEMLEAWNERNDPPLSVSELRVIVDSVNKAASKPPLVDVRPTLEAGQEPFALRTFQQFMLEYGGMETPWIVPGWLPDQTIGMLVAPPGSYKTWAELDLAVSVATGTKFFGTFPVERTGPVIIVQQEDFHGALAERMAVIVQSRIKAGARNSKNGDFSFTMPPEVPIYLHPDRRLRFSDKVVMDALEEHIKAIRPRLVIVDPLYSTGDTDDFLTKTVQYMFAMKTWRDRYGCSFVLAHHTHKRTEGTGREDLWGSQFLNAFLETGWQMRRRDQPGQITIRRHFKVSQDSEEAKITFNIQTEGRSQYEVKVESLTPGQAKLQDEKQGPDIMAAFEGGGKSLSPADVAAMFDTHRSTASRRLTKLVQAGVLKITVDGKYALATDLTQ